MKIAPNPLLGHALNVAIRTVVVLLCAWLGWLSLLGTPTTAITKEVVAAALVVALAFTFIAHLFELDDGKEDFLVMVLFGAGILWGVASVFPQYVSAGESWMSLLSGGLIGIAQIPFVRTTDEDN